MAHGWGSRPIARSRPIRETVPGSDSILTSCTCAPLLEIRPETVDCQAHLHSGENA